MSYIETVNAKRQATAQRGKEENDLGAMLAELKKMQMAALMGTQGKSTVILTDQTDLGDKLKEMNDKLVTAIQTADTTKTTSEQLTALKDLHSGLQQLTQAVQTNKTDNSGVIAAIKGLKLDPVIKVDAAKVTVPTPQVTVQAPKVDLTPLQDTLKQYFTPPEAKIDLSCYRAQDIIDKSDVQYIGFVNPDGNWYIIENKINDNSLRYVFGVSSYAKAFKKAAQYQYLLLDEAINALSA